jgi:hypothetical protein
MTSVFAEGARNRRVGSHELNRDSSRSHSLMTLVLTTTVRLFVSGGSCGRRRTRTRAPPSPDSASSPSSTSQVEGGGGFEVRFLLIKRYILHMAEYFLRL